MALTRLQAGVVVVGVLGLLYVGWTCISPPNPIVHVKAGRRPVLEVMRELSRRIPPHSRITIHGRAAVDGDCVISTSDPQRARSVVEDVTRSAGLRHDYHRFEPFYDELVIRLLGPDAASPPNAVVRDGVVWVDGVVRASSAQPATP